MSEYLFPPEQKAVIPKRQTVEEQFSELQAKYFSLLNAYIKLKYDSDAMREKLDKQINHKGDGQKNEKNN